MLNKRCYAILKQIMQDPVTVRHLSEAYKLSQRSIRNDLRAIDNFLKENNLPPLLRKREISLPCSEQEGAQALALAEKAANHGLLPEERVQKIIMMLLGARGHITYEEVARVLDVSKNTAVSDLNKLRGFYPFKSAGIEVVPGQGICFAGDEADIREAWVAFMFRRVGIGGIFVLMQPGTEEERFAKCLRDIARALNFRLQDNVFVRILLHLIVTNVRIEAGHEIEKVPWPSDWDENCKTAARMALDEIYRGKNGRINPNESLYMAGLMAECLYNDFDNRAEVQIMLLEMVSSVERALGMSLMQDTELLKALDQDICAIADDKALFLPAPAHEDIYKQVSQRFPDVYWAVKNACALVEENVNRRLSQEEVTHLLMPFVEAVQRNRPLAAKPVNILVVCSVGQATSRLLCYQLLSLFDVNIVEAINFNQFGDSAAQSHVDLIVSTIALGHVSKPHILVSPLLTADNLEALKAVLPTKVIDHNLFSSLIKVVEKNSNVLNPEQLAQDMAALLSIKSTEGLESKPNLCDILPPENILLDIDCVDWRESVRTAGGILVNNGYAEEAYVNEMVKNVEKNGPYIVVAKGVAMPHAGLKLVKRAGMSLLRLSRPVSFGNPQKDPVGLVFALCTPHKTMHLEALRQFSLLIGDEVALEQIMRAKHVEDVVRILETKGGGWNEQL